jgi:transposase
MPVSGDTVPHLVRRRPLPPCPPPRVVGTDDWVWLRGRRYGTIVCGLERRRVAGLLPCRSAAPVRAWLAAHPGIAVVSRDRAGPSAEAARTGAPGAVQVADRWHPLANASKAPRGVVERHQAQIRDAAARSHPAPAPAPPVPVAAPSAPTGGDRRRARHAAVAGLHAEGLPNKENARRAGVARSALRRWLRAGEFVPYRRVPGPSLLDPHLPFAEERWRAGLRNSVEPHRELGARGLDGGYDIVRRWAARRRREQGAPARPPSCRVLSTRRTTRLLTADPVSLSTDDRGFVDALLAPAPALRAAAEHVRAFADRVWQREPAAVDAWLEAAATVGLDGFVAGLRQDVDAVRAAATEPWSNGPVEGQINRLKQIQR